MLRFCHSVLKYRIRPNYHTACLGFSKLLGTLSCGKICIYLLRKHYKKKIRKGLIWWWLCNFFFSDFLYKGICCGYSFELHRQVSAIQMCTHSICFYKLVDKKYSSCNLKTTELPDCALIGVFAVFKSNAVSTFSWNCPWKMISRFNTSDDAVSKQRCTVIKLYRCASWSRAAVCLCI